MGSPYWIDTPAGQRPTDQEMVRYGLTDNDLPCWWAFLRFTYPPVNHITDLYSPEWWKWFKAGWETKTNE